MDFVLHQMLLNICSCITYQLFKLFYVAQLSIYVHKGGLKPLSFYLISICFHQVMGTIKFLDNDIMNDDKALCSTLCLWKRIKHIYVAD